MPFRTRNPYYLRISEKNVLPLYLYLDEHHLDWMSDIILQHVLSDLRPHILPKLKAEADVHLAPAGYSSSRKATVDTHRGETYQFCYFFRRTEPHSVIVKTRNFIAAPPHKKANMPPPPIPSSKLQRAKRKVEAAKGNKPSENARKKRKKAKGNGRAREDEDDSAGSSVDDEDPGLGDQNAHRPRRSRRATAHPAGWYQDKDDEGHAVDNTPGVLTSGALEIGDSANCSSSQTTHVVTVGEDEVGGGGLSKSTTHTMDVDPVQGTHTPLSTTIVEIDLEVEEEEEKPKPALQLEYRGFSIYGHCLCVVVEPWPKMRPMSRALSVVQETPRAQSIASVDFVPAGDIITRAKTPLFLPDDAERERSETPAQLLDRRIVPVTIPLSDTNFNEDSSDSDDGGMIEFSQVLNAAGDFRAGAADDNEDMDGAVLFGDADEAREL